MRTKLTKVVMTSTNGALLYTCDECTDDVLGLAKRFGAKVEVVRIIKDVTVVADYTDDDISGRSGVSLKDGYYE